jgi:hypothetical protein
MYERPSGPIEVSGRVVLAGQGPLEDLGVELLRIVPPGVAVTMASTRTDAQGSFELRHVVPEGTNATSWRVEVNAPYDSRYTVDRRSLPAPPVTLDLGTFELRLNDNP